MVDQLRPALVVYSSSSSSFGWQWQWQWQAT